jgi:hypothetical protein
MAERRDATNIGRGVCWAAVVAAIFGVAGMTVPAASALDRSAACSGGGAFSDPGPGGGDDSGRGGDDDGSGHGGSGREHCRHDDSPAPGISSNFPARGPSASPAATPSASTTMSPSVSPSVSPSASPAGGARVPASGGGDQAGGVRLLALPLAAGGGLLALLVAGFGARKRLRRLED